MKNIGKTAVILVIISVVAKLFGLLRDVVLADCYGAGSVSDAYLIAISVPTLLFYFIGNALSTSFIPMYTKVEREKGTEEAQKYTDRIMTVSLLLSTAIALLLIICPRGVVAIFASGFDEERISLTADIIRMSAVTIYFMTAVNIFSSRLQLNESFAAVALVSFPRNFFLIVSVILSTYFGLWWLGLGIILAYLGEFILLLIPALRNRIYIRLRFSLKDPYLLDTLKMVLPVFLAVAVSQINKVIDRTIASNLDVGSVSSLYYASIINTSLQEVLVSSLVVIVFTNVSKLVANKEYGQADAIYHKTVRMLRFILMPATVGMLILAVPVVELMFGRGNFDTYAVSSTAAALRGYTIGLCFLASREVLIKVFYAYKKTSVTFAASVFGILINIGLNLVLVIFWGATGLAVATSVSAICQYVILIIYYHAKMWKFSMKAYFISMLKPLIGCVLMGGAVFALDSILTSSFTSIFRLLIDVAAGVLIYGLVEFLLRADEMNYIKNFVINLFKKRNHIKPGE